MVSLKDQKILWGKAAGLCSMPSCRASLFEDPTEADDEALIGENCHIVGEKKDGPRGTDPMELVDRNKYPNLVLLCRNHHKIIDSQITKYTIEKLHKIKRDHEQWVIDNLIVDAKELAIEKRYSEIVDGWSQRCDLENWTAWTSNLLSGDLPSIPTERYQNLQELRSWLMSRVWPKTDSFLESAFMNFFSVLKDFQSTFSNHADFRTADEWVCTKKFYQIEEWDEEKYHRLFREFDHHVGLVQDYVLELTRAANLVCDAVRNNLSPTYRLNEGRLLVQTGPNEQLRWTEMAVEYNSEEIKENSPYHGFSKFETQRRERDVTFA